MEYELTIFCLTVIVILALAYGDRGVAKHALDIMSGLVLLTIKMPFDEWFEVEIQTFTDRRVLRRTGR